MNSKNPINPKIEKYVAKYRVSKTQKVKSKLAIAGKWLFDNWIALFGLIIAIIALLKP